MDDAKMLVAENAELKRALHHARAVADAERQRAALLEESCRRAYQFAAGARQARQTSDGPEPTR
jgi:O-succinylbenzoate synthase